MGDWDWGYSLDQERYRAGGETRDEAIRRGMADAVMREQNGDIWVCQLRPITVCDIMPDAAGVLDEAERRADEEYGCEDWPRFGGDAIKELDSLLSSWAEKHSGSTTWYTTDGFEPERVTVER